MERYFVIYKPCNMVSQFVSPDKKTLLGDLDYQFPEGTQAVGRLDEHSEGLLLLTTDKSLVGRLMHPNKKHKRVYVVHVKREIDESTLEQLRNGIEIQVKKRGAYMTLPCQVEKIEKPAGLAPHANAYLEMIPHSWLQFTLTEGKNRQIRKMCAAVKHTCRRLIRTQIENLTLDGLQPGEVREIEKEKLFDLLLLN